MDLREEYIKEFRQGQEKYIYYLLAIPIAAIGFSVNITMDRKLVVIDSILALAILFWLISVLYGLLTIKKLVSSIAANIDIIDIRSGIHPLIGTHTQKIQVGVEAMMEVFDRMSNESGNYMKIQRITLYIGAVLFIVWRVLDMLPDQALNDLLTQLSINVK